MSVTTPTAEITLTGHFLSQEIKNVFFYQCSDFVDSDILAQLLDLFEDQFFGVSAIGLRQEIFSTQMLYERLDARLLQNPDPIASSIFATPYTGNSPGDVMPPYVSVSFKSTRRVGSIRSGHKRFAGVIEASQNGGTVNSAYDADLDDLGAKLAEELTTGIFDFTPVIVKRVHVPATESEPEKWILPNTLLTTNIAPADEWTHAPELTTQNSRKKGRGA